MANPSSDQALLPGTTLYNGKYLIIHQLGQGGFGITYFAKHQTLGNVAIKELFLNCGSISCSRDVNISNQVKPLIDSVQFEKYKTRFLDEAKTMHSLSRVKGVVKVNDIFEENGTVYFAMEYLKGVKLDEYIRGNPNLSEEEKNGIVIALCDALKEVHKHQILHCDIKPSNILVSPDGDITLIDFGIARYYEISDDSATRTVIHTPGYSPPEQKVSNAPLSTYSDVYSLGATTYFIFTGQAPQSIEARVAYEYLPPSHFYSDISFSVEKAINKSLALRPEDRFQTVDAFLNAFQETFVREKKIQNSSPSKNADPEDKTQILPIKELEESYTHDGKPSNKKTRKEEITIVDLTKRGTHQPSFWAIVKKRYLWFTILTALGLITLIALNWPINENNKNQLSKETPSSSLPDYRVVVNIDNDSLYVGNNQIFHINIEPKPTSSSKAIVYVNGVSIKNDLGTCDYNLMCTQPGLQQVGVKIEVTQNGINTAKNDSVNMVFTVLEKILEKETIKKNVFLSFDLYPLAKKGKWFSQKPGRKNIEIPFNLNLTQVDEKNGSIGYAINAVLENDRIRNGIEFVPSQRPGAKIIGSIPFTTLPSNPVFVAELGFRKWDGNGQEPAITYNIGLYYEEIEKIILRGGKKYENKLTRICVPIPLNKNKAYPRSISFEINNFNRPENDRLVLVNPRIVDQKKVKTNCN